MNRVLFLFFSFLNFSLVSQIGPRTWQDHTSLDYCNSVAKLGTKIYGSFYNGVVKVEAEELGSPETLTKINGLSDVGVRLLRTNPHNNKLLVIYDNCNIDVIDLNENVVNYPDIKLKTLNGKKIINEVFFSKQLAYLACGFGIVVFDTDKLEVKDTYIIGAGGAQLEVYQVALTDSLMFAATPQGLLKCNYKTKTPNNFNNWKLDTSNIPQGAYSGVINMNGTVLAAYSPHQLIDTLQGKDTLYILKNNVWSKFYATQDANSVIQKLKVADEDIFALTDAFGVKAVNVHTSGYVNYITNYQGDFISVSDIFIEQDPNSFTKYSFWVATEYHGLFQTTGYYPFYPQNKINKSGIRHGTQIGNIDVFNGKVAVAPSYPDVTGVSAWINEGVGVMSKDGSWINLPNVSPANATLQDINAVLFDRKDSTRLWASTWEKGLLLYENNKPKTLFTPSNSAMPALRCSGLAMDEDGNLWIANSNSKNYLSVIRKKDGMLRNYAFEEERFVRKIFIDKNNYVWILHERDKGITVFKHDDNLAPVQYVYLTSGEGKGNLPSNAVYSAAEDKDGKIWVGTDLGVQVFYNPSAVFSDGNFDSQPIKIVQDGNVELLLGKEVVTSIAVDGASNKWCGTQSGGVYCFSSDGLTQLYHFTKENSPLYSNAVVDINYDEATGDVYIGTERGLQSYRSTVVKGEEAYSNVYAFPNPVKPNYSGTVLVRGLVDNSIVKITDVSGNLVWETKSQGGQIEWNVRTLSGARVTAGVYMVYASTTGGELRAVTKVLVIN